ncbi:MAG: ABC transporter substrate-binding protein [Dehalococcoidia bacterium]
MAERNYWMRSPVSRRAALRGAALGSAGLAGAALIGCGGADEDDAAVPAPAATTAATASPRQAAAAAATEAAGPPQQIKRGGTFKSYETGDPTSLDPYGGLDHATKGFASSYYSRLYMRDTKPYPFSGLETGLKGDLAESAETEDGVTWIVKLKQGPVFHNVAPVNGRAVTVEDVKFSWDRLKSDPAAGSEFVAFIDRMDVVDERTLKFTTKEPAPQMLETLADGAVLYIVPTEYEGGYDPKTTVIGSGPWVLDDYRPSEAVMRAAHKQWHHVSDHDGQPLPLLDRWEGPIIPEYQSLIAQFETGQLYSMAPSPDDVISVKERHPELWWSSTKAVITSFMYFDHAMTTDQPWGDERVRQAFSHAMDRVSLLDLGYNITKLKAAGLDVGEDQNNIVPAGEVLWWLDPFSEAHGPSSAFFKYDPAAAKQLLAAAGHGDGFAFDYHYTPRYGTAFVTVAEAQHAMMQAIGLKPNTVSEDYNAVYITHTFRNNFSGVAFGYETPFSEIGSYFQRYFTDHAVNHSGILDPQLIELTAKQAQAFEYEERRDAIHEIQRINATHMYYVPMSHGGGTTFTGHHPWVGGYRQSKGYGAQADTHPYYWIDPDRMKT